VPTAAWLRERYKRNKAAGICPTCIRNKVPAGRVTCKDCEEKNKKHKQRFFGRHRVADKKYYNKLRDAAFDKLGNRCANPNCRWLNEDGTFGCTDKDMLQIDHVDGGGVQEHKALKYNHSRFHKKVIADTTGKYQLLCANCNWKKRKTKDEQPRNLQKPSNLGMEVLSGPVSGGLLETGV
jgi:hypothetical protein